MSELPVQTQEEQDFWVEEYECATMFLDSQNVSKEVNGEVLSLVGRLKLYAGTFEYPKEAEDTTTTDSLERLKTQLAGCSVAAFGGTKEPAVQGDYGWSPAYQDVLDLRMKYEDLLKGSSNDQFPTLLARNLLEQGDNHA